MFEHVCIYINLCSVYMIIYFWIDDIGQQTTMSHDCDFFNLWDYIMNIVSSGNITQMYIMV